MYVPKKAKETEIIGRFYPFSGLIKTFYKYNFQYLRSIDK
jgi:hypothetical protein